MPVYTILSCSFVPDANVSAVFGVIDFFWINDDRPVLLAYA
ncbi:hypothetical protein KESI111651_02150 [Kerstersia similis]